MMRVLKSTALVVLLLLCCGGADAASASRNGDDDGNVAKMVEQGNAMLTAGAPEAALDLFRRAQRIEPTNNAVAIGLMQSRHLAHVLSNAVIAGEIHPVDWEPVHRAIKALKDGTIKLHNPSFKVRVCARCVRGLCACMCA